MRRVLGWIGLWAVAVVGLWPSTAAAEIVCGTVAEFNAAMAAAGTTSADVTLTYDLTGVAPPDLGGAKGSLGQMRNTTCATLQDATIKVYSPEEPPNDVHPPGTLKLEYINDCCAGGACGEQWADPNPSVEIFVDGSETCAVSMWVKPTEVGYSFVCNTGTFDAVGANPQGNTVDKIHLLEYALPDGGTTWEIPNASATNDQVCWDDTPAGPGPGPGPQDDSVTVSVLEDVTTGPAYPDTVFPDPSDLAVEAGDNQVYLKFQVPPYDGKVTGVRLNMRVGAGASADGDGGEVHTVLDSSWSETTLTWNTRPSPEAASLGWIGPGGLDAPVSVDLGAVLDHAGGTYSFALVAPPGDSNGTHLVSKEGSPANAATLVVDYTVVDADGDGANDGPDCDDADANVGPEADEACNGIDDDCDGEVDEDCTGGGDDSGGTAGDGAGDDGGGGGTGESSIGFPGARGGEDDGCGCTSGRDAPTAAWLTLLLVGLRRRRRDRRV